MRDRSGRSGGTSIDEWGPITRVVNFPGDPVPINPKTRGLPADARRAADSDRSADPTGAARADSDRSDDPTGANRAGAARSDDSTRADRADTDRSDNPTGADGTGIDVCQADRGQGKTDQ